MWEYVVANGVWGRWMSQNGDDNKPDMPEAGQSSRPVTSVKQVAVRRLSAWADSALAFLLITVSIYFASISIAEYGMRNTAVANLQRDVLELNMRLADMAKVQPAAAAPLPVAAGGGENGGVPMLTVAATKTAAENTTIQLEKLQFVLGMTRAVEMRGRIVRPDTISDDRCFVRVITLHSLQMHGTGDFDERWSCQDWAEAGIQGTLWQPSFIAEAGLDMLLIFTLLACGALGSMLAGLWVQHFTSLRDFSLGLGAGFIVFLATKGGKFLFTLPAQGEVVALNPYGMAFSALLVGLYLNRAYEFLGHLVDRFTSSTLNRADGKAGQNAP